MRYYIKFQNYEDGPHDLVAMIRKIRRGSLEETALIYAEGEAPVAAGRHPKFASFFQEAKGASAAVFSDTSSRTGESPKFTELLGFGWRFFQKNLSASIYIAAVVLLAVTIGLLLNSALPNILKVIAIYISFVMGLFGISLTSLAILRMHRGQPAGIGWLAEQISIHGISLLTFSAVWHSSL